MSKEERAWQRTTYKAEYVEVPYDWHDAEAAKGEWDVEKYMQNVSVKIIEMSNYSIEFDVCNLHPSFANALRRILIAEVPTVAIEKVKLFQNTSVIPDEVLVHRLGLIPLRVNPKKLAWTEPVYSRDLTWVPLDGQNDIFKKKAPRPAYPDILIDELTLNDIVEADCYCVKGIGRDHAKFSPVAACFYRFHPEIKLHRDLYDNEAELLKENMSKGVIDCVPCEDGRKKAVVSNARLEMCSGNHFRIPELAQAVTVTSHMDHLIFTVESVGQMKVAKIIAEAFEVMKTKCDTLLEALNFAT
ncbi:DNA directed RNA polymerases I and III subunit [Trichuris trichiura]|uniref:DNA directed RNA polymerases I and III subunit n=1 Tax=Trichuris trichiura TaxID=36087 RepID=A0A077Z3G9_TRITR|nr:DNA directed RNA polymerases I and III subunit [Trichuris trichiura]